jgi:hypothetical protein
MSQYKPMNPKVLYAVAIVFLLFCALVVGGIIDLPFLPQGLTGKVK